MRWLPCPMIRCARHTVSTVWARPLDVCGSPGRRVIRSGPAAGSLGQVGGGTSGGCREGEQMAASGVAAMIVHGTADATVRTGMYSRDYWLAANGCSGAATVPTDPAP